MVLNLCLPPFCTTVHCNKLCADGYDVTNLVSADPALRRRGFKLEYFLRPPLQVTLKFDFQVELCRVDVELWPFGMDQGQACKKLEISTSSEPLRTQNSDHRRVEHQEQAHQTKLDGKSSSDGKKLQAQRLSKETLAFKSNNDSEFKLVGRCELRDETKVYFTRANFRPRPPFTSRLPPQPANCRREELWSRGLLSLGAVTQLRVTVPFGGAASALGLKALVVWGQPAHCCPAEEVERIKKVLEASQRPLPGPVGFPPSVRPPPAATLPSRAVPEEFLDQITQEVMMLPMLLPSGVSVDSTTLEEHQKREATWGRPPNDPFTGVPFTSASQPLPNPQLKSRIDRFLLENGMARRDGMLGRKRDGEDPHASMLISTLAGRSQDSVSSVNNTQYNAGSKHTNRTTQHLSDTGNQTCHSQTTDSESEKPRTKRPRNDAVAGCSSHEQRLSASLDEALFSALQGRPSFTSNLSPRTPVQPEPEPLNASQRCHTTPSTLPGEKTCSACSRSVSAYSTSSIYRLTCGHLLCGSCLRRDSPTPSASSPSASSPSASTPSASTPVQCPACQSSTPRCDVIRVHH